jgi:hypothetical protein
MVKGRFLSVLDYRLEVGVIYAVRPTWGIQQEPVRRAEERASVGQIELGRAITCCCSRAGRRVGSAWWRSAIACRPLRSGEAYGPPAAWWEVGGNDELVSFTAQLVAEPPDHGDLVDVEPVTVIGQRMGELATCRSYSSGWRPRTRASSWPPT